MDTPELDEKFPLRDARRFPPYDSHTSQATLHRHATRGGRAVDGRMVRLKTVKYPKGKVTCRRWIELFLTELNTPASQLPAVNPGVVAAAGRRKAHAAAVLDAVGV